MLRTPLCDMLGIETPILLVGFFLSLWDMGIWTQQTNVQAGMGGIAGPELVAEVSKAGGFGVFGSAIDVANKGPEELLEEIKKIKEMCKGKPFGVDILVHGADGGVMKQLIDAFADGGCKAFISGKGTPSKKVVEAFHARNMLVASIAGKVSHAVKAMENGCDFVICQGAEGGGHTGEVFTSVLVPQVVDAMKGKIPVVAAGGIFDGRGVAAMLALGAQGVWVGTRFMLTPEANTHIKYKERLLKATSDDTTVTKSYTGARLRVLKNPYVLKFEKNPSLLEKNSAEVAKRAWNDGVWKLHGGNDKDYDDSNQAYVVGQAIGAIDTLIPAGDIVREMTKVAVATLALMKSKVVIGKNGVKINTPLTKKLGFESGIMLAGMGGIAGKEAVAAVSNSNGFGVYGSALSVANLGPDELLKEIQEIQSLCGGNPFGVDILVHGSDGGVMKQLIEAFAKGGAKLFVSGKGNPRREVVNEFHSRGMLVASIAGKVSHAKNAEKAGVDFVIVQGAEGGGHSGDVGLSVLLPQVVDAVSIPVVAAGGIYDGRGICAAICFGAQAVWVGTRFMMSTEANTSDLYKKNLLGKSSDDTMITKALSGSTMRVIRNPYLEKFEKNPALLEENSAMIAKRAWNDGVWKLHSGDAKDYDIEKQALVTGQCIGAIKEIKPCGDIIQEMMIGVKNVVESNAGVIIKAKL